MSTRILAVALCGFFALASQVYGQLSIDGKPVQLKDLSPKLQVEYFKIQQQSYRQEKMFWDEAVFEKHVEKLAKAKGVSAEQIEDEILKIEPPTENELKQFYKDNQSRISYPYETIKEDLKKYVADTKMRETKQRLIDKLISAKGVVFSLKEPTPPKLEVNTAPFFQKGQKSSKITLVEFADYKCPHCAQAEKVVSALYEKYKDDVSFVFIDFPLRDASEKIAIAAYCSKEQGKYWQYHKKLFENQKDVNDSYLVELSKELGLDLKKWESCRQSAKAQDIVSKGKAEGARLGIAGTPSFFLNGYPWSEPITFEAFDKAIAKLKKSKN